MDTSSKVGTFVPVAGILVGAVGLILGITALVKAQGAAKAAAEAAQAAQEVRAELQQMDSTIQTTRASSERALTVSNGLQASAQRAFDQVNTDLGAIRTSINKMTLDMQELAKRPVAAAPSGGATKSGAPTIPPGTLADDGTYIIKAGDTLTAIAKRFNLQLSQLMDANPGLDPRRMRPGQKINVPGAKPPSASGPSR